MQRYRAYDRDYQLRMHTLVPHICATQQLLLCFLVRLFCPVQRARKRRKSDNSHACYLGTRDDLQSKVEKSHAVAR